MDESEVKLRPQAPTFEHERPLGGEDEMRAPTPPTPEAVPRGSCVADVDGDAVLADLLEGRMGLDELTGTQSMALLVDFVEGVMELSKRPREAAAAVFEDVYGVVLGLRKDTSREPSVVPEVYRPLLERVQRDKQRVLEERRRSQLVSASQEELGVSLRMQSKMMSNFDEGLYGSSQRTEGSSESSSSEAPQYEEPLLPLTVKDLKRYVGANVGMLERTIPREDWEAFGRKFYLKSAPKVTIGSYIERINRYAGISGSVGLCAGLFLMRFLFNVRGTSIYTNQGVAGDSRLWPLPLQCEVELMEVTPLNVFRLVLTAIRLALKLVEDKNFQQGYFCRICGLQRPSDLFRMELAMGFGLNWGLMMNQYDLWGFVLALRAIKEGLA